ncbi:hypothetical protein ACJDU8_04540 [Clostridium sp. WILCCON 0269]|uniref:Uncharacterized protein n=1 Tax=Candidatus Clostridium eludens TaxID=3381663 RepID=A0ABW8SI41_9CLOT
MLLFLLEVIKIVQFSVLFQDENYVYVEIYEDFQVIGVKIPITKFGDWRKYKIEI